MLGPPGNLRGGGGVGTPWIILWEWCVGCWDPQGLGGGEGNWVLGPPGSFWGGDGCWDHPGTWGRGKAEFGCWEPQGLLGGCWVLGPWIAPTFEAADRWDDAPPRQGTHKGGTPPPPQGAERWDTPHPFLLLLTCLSHSPPGSPRPSWKLSASATAWAQLWGCRTHTQLWISSGRMLRNCSSTSSSMICSLLLTSGLSQPRDSSRRRRQTSRGPAASW